MYRSSLLILSLVVIASKTDGQSERTNNLPAIAMYCGKNTQYRDLTTGQWTTDPSGNQDCINDVAEMLQYCKKVYPDMAIVNVARESNSVRVPSWCALGHHGSKCKGHSHSVVPVRCITAEQTPTFVAKTGCDAMTISDESLCKGSSYWSAKASERCQDENKILSEEQQQNILPCKTIGKFRGIQFACCNNAKPQPKIIDVDPICTQPMKSGLCRAAFDAYYFNTETASCQHFIYGGCGGNENRFNSMEECQERCQVQQLIRDPLLDMGVGPVILDEKPTTETTTSTTVSREQSSASYFDAPLDPNSEQEWFSSALKSELQEHKGKLSSLMNEWNSAKSDILKHRGSAQDGRKIDSDLQREIAALRNEHQRKRDQITSVHHARMDASIVGARTSSYNDFMSELNKDDVQPSSLLKAFRRYLQAELKDQHHTAHLLQRATEQNTDQVPALQTKLTTIQERVNNALMAAQQKLGPGETSSSLAQLASDMMTSSTTLQTTTTEMPLIMHDDVMEKELYPSEPERPRIIDYGGLPPENVNYREEINENEDSMGDDIDPGFSKETPAPLLPDDFMQRNEDDVDYGDFNPPHPQPLPIQEESRSYDEHWLVWLGVGGACLLAVVVVIAAARAMGTKYNQKRQFARVEVEDHLTPEERQLLQMQHSGYENPTYKFFEKQQQQA